MDKTNQPERFHAAPFIKEIGRGQKGARSLSREDAYALYSAMLDGRVSDMELGAIHMAMRIKGESPEELAGFLDAVEASFERIEVPQGEYAPIVIPSYNGSRRMPNLTPLLALLLARAGAPVLVHGVMRDPGRVTTAEIFEQLGLLASKDPAEAGARLVREKLAFIEIDALAPKAARLLAMRSTLGVRSSAHTLVKLLQPFSGPALRLVSYTHPEYFTLLTEYFLKQSAPARGDAFLMRGTEGEPVANAKRAHAIDWLHEGERTTLSERQEPTDEPPRLPAASDAATTARWIEMALKGDEPVPAAIEEQVGHCLRVSKLLGEKSRSA